MSNTILIKRGIENNRSSITPSSGELILTTDTHQVFVGDGSTAGGIRVSGQLIDTGTSLSSIQVMSNTLAKDVTIHSGTSGFSIGELVVENGAIITVQNNAQYKVL